MRTKRIQELKDADKLEYPAVAVYDRPMSTRTFRTRWTEASKEEVAATSSERFAVFGRVLSIRQFGNKFSFVSIVHDGCVLQIMLNFTMLIDRTDEQTFKEFHQLLNRGDYICKPVVAIVVAQFVLLTSLSWQL